MFCRWFLDYHQNDHPIVQLLLFLHQENLIILSKITRGAVKGNTSFRLLNIELCLTNMVQKLREAAETIYNTNKYQKREEFTLKKKEIEEHLSKTHILLFL